MLRVLSLGAGVQSSTLALMIEKGEVPMVNCAVFSDTMGEPKAVYEWVEWLKKQLSYPVYTVSKGNLKQDMLNGLKNNTRYSSIPFYTKNENKNTKGILWRQCSADYKIVPINQKVRELLGLKKRQKAKKDKQVEMLMGISYDEIIRMKMNRLPYITNIFPLIDLEMKRHDCVEWMKKHNYPSPPRSACTFCPYHSNYEWRKIKENKEEWDECVELDRKIRNNPKLKDQAFLHKDRVPLDQVDLRTDEEKGQLNLLDECEGICGV